MSGAVTRRGVERLMSADAVIYGSIDGAPAEHAPPGRYLRFYRHNRSVLRGLPVEDKYPPLVRGMFAITTGWMVSWQTHTIHFGWSARNFAQHWPEWRDKFEGLLHRLCWWEARVHIEAEYEGKLTCRWVIRPHSIGNWRSADPPVLRNEWNFFSTGVLAG